MSLGISKTSNEYARLVTDIDAPKAVWMALAVSFADHLTGETGKKGLESVGDHIFKEWEVLHQNGIVPQKPRRTVAVMAAGILPRPGTKVGPCKTNCKHIDCAETRDRAASKCIYCRKTVGFGVRIYQHGEYTTVHARCHEDAAEQNAAMF